MNKAPTGTPLTRAELEPVLLPLEHARPFPRRAFIDRDVFEFEMAHIFCAPRTWLCVGRADEIELPGQWIRVAIAESSALLIVRGADLRVRAFFDVCRHRGASLVSREACGRAGRRIECPYHGWTYELDGRLALAPHAPPSLDKAANGLRDARVETWRGFLFVNAGGAAEDSTLEAFLGEPAPWMTPDVLQSIKLGRAVTYTTNANWKLLVENFQESHHFPHIHRALESLTPTSDARTWMSAYGGAWLGGTMEIDKDVETVSLDGSMHGRPVLAHVAAGANASTLHQDPKRTVFDAMIFPSLFTSLQPDYLLTYRLHPLAVDRTEITASIYFHPAAFVAGFDPQDVYALWDRINLEDKLICEDQQANALASRAFDPACYATVEEGMHAFDRMVAKIHLAAASEDEAAAAAAAVVNAPEPR